MIIARRSFVAVLLFCFTLTFLGAPRAHAEASFGDAALTVAVGTLAGAVLGASTLPFYEESGDHTNNIFYGAAIGAVIGVFISAYAGVKEGPGDDDAWLAPRKPSVLSVNDSPLYRLHAETSSATRAPASFGMGTTVAWSPVKTFRF